MHLCVNLSACHWARASYRARPQDGSERPAYVHREYDWLHGRTRARGLAERQPRTPDRLDRDLLATNDHAVLALVRLDARVTGPVRLRKRGVHSSRAPRLSGDLYSFLVRCYKQLNSQGT